MFTITARAAMLGCVLCLLTAACGYSELEMQAQRDKITALTGSLDTLNADHIAARALLLQQRVELAEARRQCPAPVTP
jgi:hypothetical protein